MVSLSPFRLRQCVFLSILIFGLSGYWRDAANGQPTSGAQSSIRFYPAESGGLLADLDGDHEPDLAGSQRLARTKDGYFYQVRLLLSSDAPTSFTVFHNNALGLKIIGVDVDGDHDVDLIISDRFFRQCIGVWLNDGKGRFAKSLPGQFSPISSADLAFVTVDLHLVGQPTGEKARRRLPETLRAAGYIQPLPVRSAALSRRPAERVVHFPIDPLCERAPPTRLTV
jgi:hypothetical protein